MKRLIFRKRNLLEWEEVPEPEISARNQAIIRPIAVARCDLDLPIISGKTLFRPPFPLGHEFVGQVVRVSDDLRNRFNNGDRVIVPFQISCGACPSCHVGNSKSCESMETHPSDFGMGPTARKMGGALSELLLIPHAGHMLMPVSPEIDPIAIASISDNIVEAWKMVGMHVHNAEVQSILVQGGRAPSIGLYCALLAHSMDKDVVYADFCVERLEIASGAGIRVMEISENAALPGRYDLVADASGTREGFISALNAVAPYGIVTTASIFFTNSFEIPYLTLYDKGVRLFIGRVNSFEWIPEVLQRIQNGSFAVRSVVTAVADFKDAREAMMQPATKLVVRNAATG